MLRIMLQTWVSKDSGDLDIKEKNEDSKVKKKMGKEESCIQTQYFMRPAAIPALLDFFVFSVLESIWWRSQTHRHVLIRNRAA